MMKKLLPLFFLITFLSMSFTLRAQQVIEYGVMTGLNIANLSGKDVPSNATSKAGLLLGFAFQYYFTPIFSIEPEVLYSMRGATTFGSFKTEVITLNYIEFPVLVKYNFHLSPKDPVYANLFVGPSIALNVGAKDKINDNGYISTVDLRNSTKALDYGLVIGAGMDFDMNTSIFSVGTRYTFGLSSMNKAYVNRIWRNGVFAITIGYSFK